MTPTFSHSLRRGLRHARRGFSLLEILVVLAILALLATLAITKLDTMFSGAQEDTAKMFVQQSLSVPLQSYRMHMGTYPSTSDGLNALVSPPATKADRWRGPYVDEKIGIPLDPWKNPYQYRFPGVKNKNSYDVWSMGPDGQDGTADDVGNWAAASTENK